MPAKLIEPRKALNKAFLRLKPSRAEFDEFCGAAANLLASVRSGESEEFHKNLISDFLKRIRFAPKYFINTKGRNDLVIHNGKTADSSVGVILEAKSPTNKIEMPRKDNLNSKALQELVLYFLRERITGKNLELRTLVVSNVDEWFLFDAGEFEQAFASDKVLVRRFVEFEKQALSGRGTEFFYKEIASPAICAAEAELSFTHFQLSKFEAALINRSEATDRRLVAVSKILSPEHLLKAAFATDGQSLDRGFYSELLHLIGLEEVAISGRKLIQRKPEKHREAGSLLENAITQMESLDKLSRIKNPERYGLDRSDRLFNLALELVITWIDRIIFLKLLEAQLIDYSGGDKSGVFLDSEHIASFDDLNALFFLVLAKRAEDRPAELRKKYRDVPYLNSSLFDPAEVEHEAIAISNLQDGLKLGLFAATALRDEKGRRLVGGMVGLQYLLRFLDAYDFGSEGADEVRPDNKKLIGPSVLGLIFEKINGYKDGSFFTPGSVTMHMCRESVRRVVLGKFNSVFGWDCKDTDALFERIDDKHSANAVINSIRVCDPAVGSGHFLVSALNEIIALKSDLGILLDRNGRTLRDYEISVANDELVVTDDDGHLFRYDPHSPASQLVQETLFHEKQAIIENCLFGVDVNANSTKICRLRLWIELLKSAYYKKEGATKELETLPNIDINIKTGDSLVSRFSLSASLSGVLRKSKWSVEDYRSAISSYQSARGRDEKRQIEILIGEIRTDFDTAIQQSLVYDLHGELKGLEDQEVLFEERGEKAVDTKRKKRRLETKIAQSEEHLVHTKLRESSFEWRIEFPQVLEANGSFAGFDLVIGNPPYGVSIEPAKRDFIEARLGKVPDHEIFYMFINLARNLLQAGGVLAFIVPNTILFNVYAEKYRLGMLDVWDVDEITDCTEFRVFSDATVRNVIFSLRKTSSHGDVGFRSTADAFELSDLLSRPIKFVARSVLMENIRNWVLVFRVAPEVLEVAARIRQVASPLGNRFPEISQGLIAYDKYQGQSAEIIEARAFHSGTAVDGTFKPWLWGGDVKRYRVAWNGQEYIKYGDRGEGIANPRQPKFFRARRLLVREITSPHILAAVTDAELYNDPGVINVLENPKGTMPIYCLLGILNSKLATFYHLNSSPKVVKGEFPKILVTDLRGFPLPLQLDGELVSEIGRLAAEIQMQKAADPLSNSEGSEAQVDSLVFRLYGISPKDVEIVERELVQ